MEETHRKNGETVEENYFSPLPLLYARFNKRWDSNGWRRPSSGGILGLLQRGEGEWGSAFSPSSVSHSLRKQTFDQPTMTGAFLITWPILMKRWRGQRQGQQGEQKWRPHHLNRSFGIRPTSAKQHCREHLVFWSSFFSISLPLFSLFSSIWSSLGFCARIAHTALSVWMCLII